MSERNSLQWIHQHVPWLCTDINVHGPCHSPTFTAEMALRGQIFRASASTKKKAKSIVASKVVAALSSFQIKKTNPFVHESQVCNYSKDEMLRFGDYNQRRISRKRPIIWNAVSILNDMRPHIKFVKSTVDCNDDRVAEFRNSSQNCKDSEYTKTTDDSANKKLFPQKSLVAMTVVIDGLKFVGVGRCQKSAKQRAARQALKEIFSLQNMFT